MWIIYYFACEEELKYQLRAWSIPELVDLATNNYPDFSTKKELILKIGTVLTGYTPSSNLNQKKATRELLGPLVGWVKGHHF